MTDKTSDNRGGGTGHGRGHVLLCTDTFLDEYGDRLTAAAPGIEVVPLDNTGIVAAEDLERITLNGMRSAFYPYRDRIRIIEKRIRPGYAELGSLLGGQEWSFPL